MSGIAADEARPQLRLPWMDWLAADSALFDIQEMIEFCRSQFAQGWSLRIQNALGRIGADQATSAVDPASHALAVFTFATPSDLAAFTARFRTEIGTPGAMLATRVP